jgi:ABC-type branched-subunit amino acid transport system substrate-binding protein
MSRKNMLLKSTVLLTASVLMLTACGSGGADKASAPGLTDDTITLGHLTDLSGPFGAVGKEYLAGAELFVKNKNADGGVCDRDLALEVRDHGYDAQKAATGYREISSKVFGMESILGDGMASALLPQLEKDNQLTSVITWEEKLLDSDAALFLPGSTYAVAAANATSWGIDKFKVQDGDTIGLVVLGGALGDGVIKGTKLAADDAGVKLKSMAIKPTDTDFTAAVTQLKNAGAKLVMLGTTPSQLATLLSTASAQGLDATWLGISPGMFNGALLDGPAAKPLQSDFYMVASTAVWSDESGAAAEVRKTFDAKAAGVPEGFGVMLGYAQFDAYAQILEQACAKGELTRESAAKVFHATSSLDTDGMIVPLDLGAERGKSQSRENFMIQPDASVEGNLKRVTDNFTAPVVKDSDL